MIATAAGGSLFLDEVTEIPLAMQGKLLRVLQEREFTPLGETRPIPFDVKIISASSLSLESALSQGRFREDLRYRLEVLPLHLPPLRARGADKRLLFDSFLVNQLARHGHPPAKVESAVYACVENYAWPGNVREMVNVCTYIAALADGQDTITVAQLPPAVRSMDSAAPAGPDTTNPSLKPAELPDKPPITPSITRESLEEAITRFDGHRESIARHFGISRMTLWRRMKKFGLD